MDTQLNLAEAKAKLSELIDLALQGGDVVIARAGKPVVRLVPVSAANANRAGFFGALSHLGPVPVAALLPEPDDSWGDFGDEDEVSLKMVAEPSNRVFKHGD
jgi:prevent-host-death family protein